MYSIEEIRLEFKKENYKLLTEEYENNKQELEYICIKHQNKGVQYTSFSSFLRGKRCPYCKYENGIYVNPLPEDIIQEETEKRGYFYCGIERNEHTKVKIICPIHQYYGIQLKNWSDIKAGKQVCSRCNGHKSLEEFQKIVHEKSPNVDIVGDFDYCSTRVHCKCNVCGYEWNPLGYNLTTKRFTGCPKCSKKTRADKRAISYEYVQKKFKALDNSIIPLSIPTRTHEVVKCKCKKCGHIWYPTFSNLTKKIILQGVYIAICHLVKK